MAGERDITFDRAVRLAGIHAIRMPSEVVELSVADGRRVAEEVRVLGDHPPFTNSAMDGWAVRAVDTPGTLIVVGESAAGAPWPGVLGDRQAVRISTGAVVPEGADAISPREQASEADGHVEVPQVRHGAFVRRRGEDARAGELMLAAGTRLAPHHLAAVAGAGHPSLRCVRQPRVSLLVTGAEVVPVGAPLADGQVWDINGTALPALILAADAELVGVRHVPDDRAATLAALRTALETADVVVTTGGVSMSDHDHVRPALKELGVQEVFWGVEIRPGHPLWLGRRGDSRVLALPGNPVSAVVCFSMFGRPLLGCDDPWASLPLAVDYRTPTPRTDLIRCTLAPEGLVPAVRQASHDITSLAQATHIAVVPAGAGQVAAGEALRAMALPS